MSIQVVILAAGKGKRMHSHLPKVLHTLAGQSLLEHVIQTVQRLSSSLPPPIIVYGHQGKIIRDRFSHFPINWAEQTEQLGTGHALLQAMSQIADSDQVLVLSCDVPLISSQTLNKLIEQTAPNALGMLTASLNNPQGYGRIQRDKKNAIVRIIEEKDATLKERTITEINPGIYLAPAPFLKKWLPLLKNNNAQQEYYLTDIIAHAVQEKMVVSDVRPEFNEEIFGINDRVQLAQLERFYQQQQAEKLMRQGVTIRDPNRLDIRGEIQIGKDVTLDVNVILEGRVIIGNECVIGPQTILRNVEIGDRVEIKANSMLDGVEVASDCLIGPFARLRPGTVLASHVHIGNFVEIKNSEIDQGTKINHLSYMGDSHIGKQVNIGAGTITCNYDGINKHKTIIGDNVHVGSDTQLVAPVTIGDGATIGAGSTITKDVPAHELTLTHQLHQRSVKNWEQGRKREELEDK
jgi:bifunctional UDP-N-acetylglucosamine pyrophosphorylase/glucosamine-1-phosphate N-acetyltransferase